MPHAPAAAETRQSDLQTLIRDAEDATDRAQASAAAAASHPIRRSLPTGSWAASGLGLVAAVVWAQFLAQGILTDSRIRQDAQTLIAQARHQVDDHVQRTGTLPAALPDVTLGRVVRYEIEDAEAHPPRYTLSTDLRGIHMAWSATSADAQ